MLDARQHGFANVARSKIRRWQICRATPRACCLQLLSVGGMLRGRRQAAVLVAWRH